MLKEIIEYKIILIPKRNKLQLIIFNERNKKKQNNKI